MGLIVLDTSVLVYAVGTEHPLRHPCRRLIAAIGDGVGAEALVSTDRAFADVAGLNRIDPAGPDFDRLLGSSSGPDA